jgi:hypothetical protein
MSDREHALLSASGSEMWLNCPPSARLCDAEPEATSPYAEEGTLAHAIAELKLRKAVVEGMPRSTFAGRIKKLQAHELYQPEMLEHTDAYIDVITGIMCELKGVKCFAEVKVDFGVYAPEGFGTCDALILAEHKFVVVDFKYGAGIPVSAVENSQLMLYALGAYYSYALLYGFQEVELVIVQPRLDNISRWTIGTKDLLAWGESIKGIAQKAFDGMGDFKAGEHCRWCRVRAKCRTRAEHYQILTKFNNAIPPLLSNDQVGDILEVAEGLLAWVKDLQEYALGAVLRGESVRGWKVVEGRSNRKFADVDTAFRVLVDSGIDESMLYTREPLAMGATEKLVGKKVFKELLTDAGLVIKPEGKPTLVKDSDSREEFGGAASDFAGLGVAE